MNELTAVRTANNQYSTNSYNGSSDHDLEDLQSDSVCKRIVLAQCRDELDTRQHRKQQGLVPSGRKGLQYANRSCVTHGVQCERCW